MTEAESTALIAAAAGEAHMIGVPMNIAVVDEAAHLKAFVRMDAALLGSLDIAIGKARTAALFGMNTEAVGAFCGPGGTSPGLENSNGGLVIFAGGVALRDEDGRLIGAIGVSGGSVDQDAGVANTAAATLSQSNEGDVIWAVGAEDAHLPPLSQQQS